MVGSSYLLTKSSKGRQFQISLPNEEDYDIEDVQCARSVLESAGSSDFSSLSASSVQTAGPNVLEEELSKLRFCHCRPPSCFETALNTNEKVDPRPEQCFSCKPNEPSRIILFPCKWALRGRCRMLLMKSSISLPISQV